MQGIERRSAVVVGASGGIGAALCELLLADGGFSNVFGLSRRPGAQDRSGVSQVLLDLEDEATIATAAAAIGAAGEVGLVIVATGILHDGDDLPEKTFKRLDADFLAMTLRINTIGPALVAKHFLPLLPRQGRSIFASLSARVGSIGDNQLGGWYGYRASKAALNMLIRTAAIELARTHPEAICIGLHPGTVATRLSEPFQAGVPADKLFSPDFAASHLLRVLDGLGPDASGGCFAWDGQRIAP